MRQFAGADFLRELFTLIRVERRLTWVRVMGRDSVKRSHEVEQAQGMLRQNIAAAKEMAAEAERLVNCSRDPSGNKRPKPDKELV
jgi:hypothetical protein